MVDSAPAGTRPIADPFRPPRRLSNELAAAVVITATETKSQRLAVLGSTAITIRAKLSASGTVRIYRCDPFGNRYTDAEEETVEDTGTELVVVMGLNGDSWVDIEVEAGVADVTITHVDAFFAPPGI